MDSLIYSLTRPSAPSFALNAATPLFSFMEADPFGATLSPKTPHRLPYYFQDHCDTDNIPSSPEAPSEPSSSSSTSYSSPNMSSSASVTCQNGRIFGSPMASQPSYIEVDALHRQETLRGSGQEQYVEPFWAGTEPASNDYFDHPFEDAMWEFDRLKEIDELHLRDIKETWDVELSGLAMAVLEQRAKDDDRLAAQGFLERYDKEFLKRLGKKPSEPPALVQDTASASSQRLPSSLPREGRSNWRKRDVRALRRAERAAQLSAHKLRAKVNSTRMPSTSSGSPLARRIVRMRMSLTGQQVETTRRQ